MRAIVYHDYGDANVLQMTDLPTSEPAAGEILIEVHASSVNPIDYRLRSGEMKGLLPGGFPRIPGYDVAGIVTAINDNSDGRLNVGDRVMAFLKSKRGGAMAQYAVCGPDVVAKIPDAMSFEDAAAIPLGGYHRITVAARPRKDRARPTCFDQRSQRRRRCFCCADR